MSRPIISGDLVDTAAALLLCQHESPLIKEVRLPPMPNAPPNSAMQTSGYEGEEHLMVARIAASAYLVACFNYATTAVQDDE